MIDTQSPPAPTDPLEHHADFLELSTLLSEDRRTSVYDYARDLRIGNADEAVADSENDGREDGLDDDTDESEPLADAAFSALDERRRCCGTGMYPFEVEDAAISTSVNAETTVYTFLALLSWFGGNAGPTRGLGHKLFEEVCARAAAEYLGGSANNAHWEVFGFPRRGKKTGFKDALDSLCTRLGEGDSHHRGRKTLPSQKDGKLDVVAWREFADKRRGKLIFFGQCATGSNWLSKVSELPDTAKWCSIWMTEAPYVMPVRAFFVPHRIPADEWLIPSVGGVFYDRCRIASLGSMIESKLMRSIGTWSSHVLASRRIA